MGAVQSQLQLRSDLAQLGISLTNYSKGGMAEQVNLERIITADVCAFAMDASAPSSIVLIASTPSAYLYLASLLQQRNFSITLVVDPHMYQQSLGRVSRVMTWEHVQSSPMWGQAENGTAHAGNGQRVVSPYRYVSVVRQRLLTREDSQARWTDHLCDAKLDACARA